MSKLFSRPKVEETTVVAPRPIDDRTRQASVTRRRLARRGGRQSTILAGTSATAAAAPAPASVSASNPIGVAPSGSGRRSTLLGGYVV